MLYQLQSYSREMNMTGRLKYLTVASRYGKEKALGDPDGDGGYCKM
jgi:hypothetical protein